MADYENFSEINDNFDTIKTLLNSIRAQGILNTSDVDKLLTGINSKLEKINTDEDIDLIKIFLSELKQNLDERHSVLISKFGAIESLFSNLLKNSSEMPKASDIKELFDIVATNLSVFSREVVSQKETLTDITLRIDNLRTDETHKRDIIKNIALLKPDLERLNNGFDSIVINLNDNFKTIVKTISSLDKTEQFDKFSDNISSIEMSASTILSALQMLDKKTAQIEESLKNVVTKDEITTTNQKIFEIKAQAHEMTAALTDLAEKQLRIDNLADKIDASVNIIATLKSTLEENEDTQTQQLVEKLNTIQAEVQQVVTNADFIDFKGKLQDTITEIAQAYSVITKDSGLTFEELKKLTELIVGLDLNVKLQDIITKLGKTEIDLKHYISETEQRITNLTDANITRVLNDLTSNTESLSSKLNQTQSSLAMLCEKNFGSVFEHVTDLRNLLSQIDENSISANNAIFSSITDRLTVFEEELRTSLEAQEKSVNYSSAQVIEQVENIKNISNVLDYKIDSSVVEIGNVKREFSALQTAVENVLALDFVSTVKDLRVDLYASKQELINTIDGTASDVSEKISTDLYSKYELLISKLDSVEDEIKKSQFNALSDLRIVLEKISSSLLDIMSYVSEKTTEPCVDIDNKISTITEALKENNLNYVENVRDIIDVIRVQVENNLKNIEESTFNNVDILKKAISENSEDIKKDIKYSYSKLLEIQDSYSELKDILNINEISSTNKFETIVASSNTIKEEFEEKISALKTSLLDKISEFKEEFTCANADKTSEFKFAVENHSNRNTQYIRESLVELVEQLKADSSEKSNIKVNLLSKLLENLDATKEIITVLDDKSNENHKAQSEAIIKEISTVKNLVNDIDNKATEASKSGFENLVNNITSLKDFIVELGSKSASNQNTQIDRVISNISSVKDLVNNIDTNSKAVFDKNFEIVAENFASIKDLLINLNDNSTENLSQKVDTILESFSSLKNILDKVDENVDGDMARQLSLIESSFESLVSQITIIFEKSEQVLTAKINKEFSVISNLMETTVTEKLESYKYKIEETFCHLEERSINQSEYIKERIANLNSVLKTLWDEQAAENLKQIETVSEQLKNIIDNTIQASSINYNELKESLIVTSNKIEENNKSIISEITKHFCDISEQAKANIEIQNNNAATTHNELIGSINETSEILSNKLDLLFTDLGSSLANKASTLKALTTEVSAAQMDTLEAHVSNILEQLELEKQLLNSYKTELTEILKKELILTSQNIEKETDVIINELIEQFDLLKASQADDVINLTTRIEELINTHIYNNIEDLKSYLDIKTDNSVLSAKLDNLNLELSNSISNVIEDLNKLLDSGAFTSAINDFRLANEVLINSVANNLNDRIENFIEKNLEEINSSITNGHSIIENKLSIFNKEFVETIVDKYEEIKLVSNTQSTVLDEIKLDLSSLFEKLGLTKTDIIKQLEELKNTIDTNVEESNKEIKKLCDCFEGLRSQISNKSFDEAFQASINKQIASLESLITEQLGHIEDISDLCATSLPDVTELNTLVKHSILESIKTFSDKLDNQDIEGIVEKELKQVKSDIITQLLNVFNQISFVAEQEEIIDFIQDKHDELITILSHIVTTSDEISQVKDSVKQLNNKINAIISSEDDVDYIYSLQDLESDIANLRLALNEMKESNKDEELEILLKSTEETYKLLESVKNELPKRTDFDEINEGIVSISTRTNKLLLASDESYKALQDNLQEFKLVINDLDERTRNFAQESGLDRLDAKLNSINNMIINGNKTNQVFNQVFEYLAEWVDNASLQINSISSKVETLDDIEQIKSMLTDLKTEANDNTESLELVEALGNVFEKQSKKIATLDKKLDRIIVESTISNQKFDPQSLEETLNKFLVAMDDKISSQQDKINNLESKLESMLEIIGNKDSEQLSKKVGGMDRQIAKLNKSIEKIASHVIEK